MTTARPALNWFDKGTTMEDTMTERLGALSLRVPLDRPCRPVHPASGHARNHEEEGCTLDGMNTQPYTTLGLAVLP